MVNSPAVEAVMRLASTEAEALRQNAIEPEQLLAGILSFSTVSVGELERHFVDPTEARQLGEEHARLNAELSMLSLDKAKLLRDLRTRMIPDPRDCGPGMVYRSAQTRQLFEAAVQTAAESHPGTVTATALLREIVRSPTPLISELLEDSTACREHGDAPSAVLEREGQDLSRHAYLGQLLPCGTCDTEVRAVLALLAGPKRKSVLLISDRDAVADGIVQTIACQTAQSCSSQALRGRRVIDIRPATLPDSDPERLRWLEKMLVEAAKNPAIILYVPPVDRHPPPGSGPTWPGLLQQTLKQRAVQVICRVAPSLVHELSDSGFDLAAHASPVWIQDRPIEDVLNAV